VAAQGTEPRADAFSPSPPLVEPQLTAPAAVVSQPSVVVVGPPPQVVVYNLQLSAGVLVFGLIPGLVALRNSGIAALTSLANIVAVIFPRVTFSEVSPGNPSSGYVVVVNPNTNAIQYTAAQVAPTVVTVVVVAPAP
jgi:hypothetical protein